MTRPPNVIPDWDLEQLEVILEDSGAWQLVVAGPGTGKSAVACQRIASLIDAGVAPSRILLISFTRTAVAELYDRIVSYAVAGPRARDVRISTIDSHAWSLRVGFDDTRMTGLLGDDSYDVNISRVVKLLDERQPGLLEFVGSLEHLIVDEAQDVIGIRADFLIRLLKCLSEGCGVTLLADPDQAIYGFSSDDDETADPVATLLDRLQTESPRPLVVRQLEKNHRVDDSQLASVFERTRREIEEVGTTEDYVQRVLATIVDTAPVDLGAPTPEALAEATGTLAGESALVLFRNRADVLIASSYLSGSLLEHRLRMSGMPVVLHPWLGWVLSDVEHPELDRSEFDARWEERQKLAPAIFAGESRDDNWEVIYRMAGGRKPHVVEIGTLRSVIGRSRPPVEVCLPDLGMAGPILGTIHASKGREADTVILVMPSSKESDRADISEAAVWEEGRVFYVGATRARKLLMTARKAGARVGKLASKRVYRRLGNDVQVEIGRDGDIERLAHLRWSSTSSVQQVLADCARGVHRVQASTSREEGYIWSLSLELHETVNVTRYVNIGCMSGLFQSDLKSLWGIVDKDQRLRPPSLIPHLYLVGVTTLVLSESERETVLPPYRQSGLALGPVVKGFPKLHFSSRRFRGN